MRRLSSSLFSFVLLVSSARAEEPPRVLASWAAGPFETRVAFDRAIDKTVASAMVDRSIGFEVAEPSDGKLSKGALRIAAARLIDEGKTLVLTTDPHPRTGSYALQIPVNGTMIAAKYNLSGVEVGPVEVGESPVWWPSLNPSESIRRLMKTGERARSEALLARPDGVTLTTMLSLPKGKVALRFQSEFLIDVKVDGAGPAEKPSLGIALFPQSSMGDPFLVELTFARQPKGVFPGLRATIQLGDDPKEHPLEPEWLTPPWVPIPPAVSAAAPLENVPNLKGGDRLRGLEVFNSQAAKCASCHKVRGEGGIVGPDLSNLAGADPRLVYRDIFAPSARIHPDYVPYTLSMKDGRVLVGTVRAEGADKIRVTDTEAKTVTVERSGIDEIRASATSIMPVGLVGAIGEDKLRDLIAFLTARAND